MPDEAREVVFPNGVPVTLLDGRQEPGKEVDPPKSSRDLPPSEAVDAVSTQAEAGLSNEAGILEKQAREAEPETLVENLLGPTGNIRPAKVDLPNKS